MSLTRKIKSILPDPTVSVTESTLSYVKCLMPNFKLNKMLLLHRELPQSLSKSVQQKGIVSDDLEATELDITGSPLEYELDYPEVDETIVAQRNWKKEEEFHSPLRKSEACVALNCCTENLSNEECSVPLLAICDGKDNDKTVLLGSYVDNGWYTTIQACLSDDQTVQNIQETPATLLKEFTNKFSVQNHKVSVTVNSTYELCGKKPGVMDLSDFLPGCFNGNLSIEVNWNTLSFHVPIMASKTILIMEIVAGCDGSHLKQLWQEITLLNRYLDLLKQSNPDGMNSETFPSSNSTTWDEMEKKLNSLLNGNIEEKSYKHDDDGSSYRGITDDMKLTQHIENVQHRQDMDFADMLWELLISCADYAQVTRCFRIILEEIQSGFAAPQITSTNSSRITKIVYDILRQKGVIPILDRNLPLQLLIDTGLEKLSRDYTHILMSTNLVDIYNIRETLSNVQGGSFDAESYRKKLTSLAQIHLCLEFTLFAEHYLHCANSNLRSIFMSAFQEYVSGNSIIRSFSDLHENQIQRLNVPIPTVAVKHIVEGLPSSWLLTLSSKSNISSITTTSCLNRSPILPPNIHPCDETNEHEVYRILKLNLSSIKII